MNCNVEEKIYESIVLSWKEWLALRKKGYTGVTSDFLCSSNKIKSLKNGPTYVGGIFDVSSNELTSLKFAPKYIGGSCDLSRNKIQSLEFLPKKICGYLDCSYNDIKSFNISSFPNTGESFVYCKNNSKDIDKYDQKEGRDIINLLFVEEERLELLNSLKNDNQPIKTSHLKL